MHSNVANVYSKEEYYKPLLDAAFTTKKEHILKKLATAKWIESKEGCILVSPPQIIFSGALKDH